MSALAVAGRQAPTSGRNRGPVVALLASTALSVTGNAMVAVIIPWLVLDRTGSPALAGIAASAAFVAMVPALLLGGPLIDRWRARRATIGADLMSAAAVAALPLLDRLVGLGIGLIVVLVAIGAVFDGPGAAARETVRPAVSRVSGTTLERVNAWGETMDGLGGLAGPALAGLGIVAVGAAGSLWVAAAMFVSAAVVTAAWLPVDRRPEGRHEGYLAASRAGLRVVLTDAPLRAIALLGMLAMLFVAPVLLVLTTHLQAAGRPGDLGLVVAAFSAGGIVGGFGYGAIATRVRRRTLLLISMTLASFALMALALLPGTVAMSAIAACVGLAFGPVTPLLAVVAQDRTQESMRGRVLSTLGSLSLLASPLGTFGAGLLLDRTGPAMAFVAIGLGCLLAAAYAALTPGLRHIERIDLLPTGGLP